MGFGGSFGVGFRGSFSEGQYVPWWLAGGVAAGDCVAAYQAKGAASYAASKINLANPGTYDAANGAAYPTWDAATGWTFDGSSKMLSTNISPTGSAYSAIVRVSTSSAGGGNSGRAFDATGFFIVPNYTGTSWIAYNTRYSYFTPAVELSSVLAFAAQDAYIDGVPAGAMSELPATIGGAIYVGNTFHGIRGLNGAIAALSFYSSTLTAAQVAAITAAMQAL